MKVAKYLGLIYFASFIFSACTNAGNKQTEDPGILSTETKPETDTVKIKLQKAVEKIASNDLQTGGFKLLSITISNLTYKPVSMKDFYLQRMEKLEKSREEYRKVNQRLINSGAAADMERYKDDSLKSNKAAETLTGLIAKADTSKTIYYVNYLMNAKTNSNNYDNTVYTKYLFIKDLAEVKILF